MRLTLSTNNAARDLLISECAHHIAAPLSPQSRPNRSRECTHDANHASLRLRSETTNPKRMRMSEQTSQTNHRDRRARERQEIAARIARFRATQERFEREREEFCTTTLEKAKTSDRPSFWS
ncbi:MAG: hypothetical protein ACRECL_03560 [Bradyrhizobium sp.]